MRTFDDALQTFRSTQRPAVKKRVESKGRREQRALALSSIATYAVPQPQLCAEMPHRFFPVREADGLCIRCGLLESRFR